MRVVFQFSDNSAKIDVSVLPAQTHLLSKERPRAQHSEPTQWAPSHLHPLSHPHSTSLHPTKTRRKHDDSCMTMSSLHSTRTPPRSTLQRQEANMMTLAWQMAMTLIARPITSLYSQVTCSKDHSAWVVVPPSLEKDNRSLLKEQTHNVLRPDLLPLEIPDVSANCPLSVGISFSLIFVDLPRINYWIALLFPGEAKKGREGHEREREREEKRRRAKHHVCHGRWTQQNPRNTSQRMLSTDWTNDLRQIADRMWTTSFPSLCVYLFCDGLKRCCRNVIVVQCFECQSELVCLSVCRWHRRVASDPCADRTVHTRKAPHRGTFNEQGGTCAPGCRPSFNTQGSDEWKPNPTTSCSVCSTLPSLLVTTRFTWEPPSVVCSVCLSASVVWWWLVSVCGLWCVKWGVWCVWRVCVFARHEQKSSSHDLSAPSWHPPSVSVCVCVLVLAVVVSWRLAAVLAWNPCAGDLPQSVHILCLSQLFRAHLSNL